MAKIAAFFYKSLTHHILVLTQLGKYKQSKNGAEMRLDCKMDCLARLIIKVSKTRVDILYFRKQKELEKDNKCLVYSKFWLINTQTTF